MIKRKSQVYMYGLLSCAASIISVTIIMYLWTILGQRGTSADASGTAGHITTSELAGLLALALPVVSVIFVYKAAVISKKSLPFLLAIQLAIVAITIIYCAAVALGTT